MVIIAPSFLSSDFSKLEQEIKDMEYAKADWIHLDIMDGHFVPQLTFGPPIIRAIRKHTKLPFDVHLMIKPVNEYFIHECIDSGSNILTVHAEIPDLHKILYLIKKMNIKTGIALNPETSIKKIIKFKDIIDIILIMTVQPGRGGQLFKKNCLKKIKQAKQILPYTIISVDGGINPITGKQAIEFGADVLVSGSFCFKNNNYVKNIYELKNCTNCTNYE